MSISLRSVASSAFLAAAVLSSIATSSTNAPADPADDPAADELLPIQPQAPYTNADWIAPGESITVAFSIGVDDLAGLLSAFSQAQAGGLVHGENADIRMVISGPAGTMQDIIATEPAFPTDENNVFVDDPFIGCIETGGTCWSSGWTATWTNEGTEITELHYKVDVFVTNGVASQLVIH